MLYVLLFVVCTLAIPVAFEIHYKGSNNILNRAGKELSEIRLVRSSLGFFGQIKAWAATVCLLVIALSAIALVLHVLSWLVKYLF